MLKTSKEKVDAVTFSKHHRKKFRLCQVDRVHQGAVEEGAEGPWIENSVFDLRDEDQNGERVVMVTICVAAGLCAVPHLQEVAEEMLDNFVNLTTLIT